MFLFPVHSSLPVLVHFWLPVLFPVFVLAMFLFPVHSSLPVLVHFWLPVLVHSLFLHLVLYLREEIPNFFLRLLFWPFLQPLKLLFLQLQPLPWPFLLLLRLL